MTQTGRKFDQDKPHMALLPPYALEAVARVLTYGAQKYERDNWKYVPDGVCAACQTYEKRKEVDYAKRWQELEALCDKYRGSNGPHGYDCMIAVSGGKDSHFQVHTFKEKGRIVTGKQIGRAHV